MGNHLLQVGCWAFQEVGVVTVLDQSTGLMTTALFPASDVPRLGGSPAEEFHIGKNRGKLRDACGKTSIRDLIGRRGAGVGEQGRAGCRLQNGIAQLPSHNGEKTQARQSPPPQPPPLKRGIDSPLFSGT